MRTEKQKEATRKWKKLHRDRVNEHHKKFMKEYIKRPEERKKQYIRYKTFKIYGKVPNGYERHHINYDSPHNFILIPIKEHLNFHKQLNSKQGGN